MIILSVVGVFAENKTDPFSNLINTVLTPARSGISYAGEKINTFSEALKDNKALKEENEALQKKISRLEEEIRQGDQYKEENETLRAMLDVYASKTSYKYAMGKVIGRSSLSWGRTLTLDCGSMNGVNVYDAVVTAEGLIGYISGVSLSSCTVVCLTDPSMSCSAILSKSHETGIAEGHYEEMTVGLLRMSLLPADAVITVGEVVYTSGLGGVFPDGLLIGTVKSVSKDESGLSQTAILTPAADPMSVRTAYVITDFEKQK